MWINRDVNAVGDIYERKGLEDTEEGFTELKMKEKEKGKTKTGGILKQCWDTRKTQGSLGTAGDEDDLHK